MKRAWLHEAAKFCAGLVTADFFTHWWLLTSGAAPGSFLGVPMTRDMLSTGMVVDLFLLIILVHYAWHVGKLPRVKERMYFVAAGAIFTVVGVGHLLRVFTGAEVVIMGWNVPIFLSWMGILVTSYLAYASFHLASRRR